MITKRDNTERGTANLGWLDSKHTFSFGDYHDSNHMGFGPLRVINEDRVEPGAGFNTHPHKNMEIISYVLDGALAHKDSMGNGSVIHPGDVQLMSAGSGVTHSEFNHSENNNVHFLQIWIIPNVEDEDPGYQQKNFALEDKHNQFCLVVSPDGEDGSLTVKQDAKMLIGSFEKDAEKQIAANPNRKYWIQIAKGQAEINGIKASSGDGLAIEQEEDIQLVAKTECEILLFDLPA